MSPRSTILASAVVPTRNRPDVLRRTLESLLNQSHLPAELIIIDASDDDDTREAVQRFAAKSVPYGNRVIWIAARSRGAAAQRNEGLDLVTQDVVWFFDDDILFQPDCVGRLWHALERDPCLGGVSAMITNQNYHLPGKFSRMLFRLMAGRTERCYAGRVFGPAINMLPEDRADLPEVVAVEWLNLGCTLYRREALPNPPFPEGFVGYSLMEDLALSLTVGRRWKLANARTARIYHDSQEGDHKSDAAALARMELVNRHYVMTRVLERCRLRDYAKLVIWETFQLAVCAVQKRAGREFWLIMKGKFLGIAAIAAGLSKDSVP